MICRLLNEARNYGIVTIQIHSPEEDSSLLKNQLKNSFKIEDVFIVKAPLGQTVTDEKIAEDFSTILLKLLPSCKNIGFSWGKIIHDGLEILSEKENHYEAMPNTSVFPLAGSMITTGYSVDAQKIVQTFASASLPFRTFCMLRHFWKVQWNWNFIKKQKISEIFPVSGKILILP